MPVAGVLNRRVTRWSAGSLGRAPFAAARLPAASQPDSFDTAGDPFDTRDPAPGARGLGRFPGALPRGRERRGGPGPRRLPRPAAGRAGPERRRRGTPGRRARTAAPGTGGRDAVGGEHRRPAGRRGSPGAGDAARVGQAGRGGQRRPVRRRLRGGPGGERRARGGVDDGRGAVQRRADPGGGRRRARARGRAGTAGRRGARAAAARGRRTARRRTASPPRCRCPCARVHGRPWPLPSRRSRASCSWPCPASAAWRSWSTGGCGCCPPLRRRPGSRSPTAGGPRSGRWRSGRGNCRPSWSPTVPWRSGSGGPGR